VLQAERTVTLILFSKFYNLYVHTECILFAIKYSGSVCSALRQASLCMYLSIYSIHISTQLNLQVFALSRA
jgi:hypothetical protein